jgi:hypothetical protein
MAGDQVDALLGPMSPRITAVRVCADSTALRPSESPVPSSPIAGTARGSARLLPAAALKALRQFASVRSPQPVLLRAARLCSGERASNSRRVAHGTDVIAAFKRFFY